MPIEKPEAPAANNTRRKFLARAALGGALVAGASPLLSALPAAAQTDGASPAAAPPGQAPEMPDGPYLVLATQIEQAAVQVYELALADGSALDDAAKDIVRGFQVHHQSVSERLIALMDEAIGKVALVLDQGVLDLGAGLATADRNTVLTTLQGLEQDIAATHLWAIGGLQDPITAKTAAQILAVENQHAVVLGRLADQPVASLVPAAVTTEGAFTDRATSAETQISDATTTTLAGQTTTTAGNETTTTMPENEN